MALKWRSRGSRPGGRCPYYSANRTFGASQMPNTFKEGRKAMTIRTGKSTGPIPLFIFLIAIALLTGPQAAAAENPLGEEAIHSSEVLIQAKNRRAVEGVKTRFLVRPETNFFDPSGTRIPLSELPVPCRAKISYHPAGAGEPMAITIHVETVMPGARRGFAPKLPE